MPENKTLHHVKASTQYKREHKADYGHEKIEILYQDKDITVILKPSGMLSVPYPGSRARTAIEVLENLMRKNGTFSQNHKPFVVHRLDRDTSGVMMFALNQNVQKKIMNTWHKMVTSRIYHAVAENPKNKKDYLEDSGIIDDPLAKNAHNVGYVPKFEDLNNVETVAARTHYKIILRGKTHTLFELSLDTGKKNQIRAHLASKGYPLAGDENYRAKTDPFHRLALHARSLEFIHPVTGEKMHFEVAEDTFWAEYVQKGDSHPSKPIWEEERHYKNNNLSVPKSATIKKLSRKQTSHMNYIEAGKLKNQK